jgi:hypothetical protein
MPGIQHLFQSTASRGLPGKVIDHAGPDIPLSLVLSDPMR